MRRKRNGKKKERSYSSRSRSNGADRRVQDGKEIEQLKNEHLDNLNQIDDLTAKKKRTNDAYRTSIKQIQNTNWTIREKIKDGKEQRKMPCKVIFDWDKGTKAIIHPQTGEVIEEQLITNEDRQMELGQ